MAAFASPLPVESSRGLGGGGNLCLSRLSSWRTVPCRPINVTLFRLTSCAMASNSENEEVQRESNNQPKSMVEKTMRWSEIPFESVTQELEAIDEYVEEEDIDEDDAWPQFLRAAAYERWGQSKLALAQLSKIQYADGIAKVPILWERRVYNSFKVGDLAGANAYSDVAQRLRIEALGNELHFAHWFEDNFKDFVPKFNGPSSAVQRGICKYCVQMYKDARNALAVAVIGKDLGVEHGVLWFLASAKRYSSAGVVSLSDISVATDYKKGNRDHSSMLERLLELYIESSQESSQNAGELLQSIETMQVDGSDDINRCIYISLYHDAFTLNSSKRDSWLDKLPSQTNSPNHGDSLNFVFAAAKQHFGSKIDKEK